MPMSFLGPPGGLRRCGRERASDRERPAKIFVEAHEGIVGGGADAVQDLAEEAAGGRRQRDVQDLGVGEPWRRSASMSSALTRFASAAIFSANAIIATSAGSRPACR